MPTGPATSLRWRWLLPVALGVALFHLLPMRTALDRAFFDAASRRPLRATPPPEGSALVLMDDATLDALSREGFGGTWPPPRGMFAALIAGLHRAGAERIVLDFVFLDHSSAEEQDRLLAALAAGTPSVVLARTQRQMPAFWDERFVAQHPALFGAPRTGFADAAPPDADGLLRTYRVPGSLAAAAAPGREGPAEALLRWQGGLGTLRDLGPRIPVVSAAQFVVAGLPTYGRLAEVSPEGNYTPAALAAALARETPLAGEAFAAVRGRTVFVGASAVGSFDQKPLPVGKLEPGVLVHWTAWANLVGTGFIRQLPATAPLLACAGLGLLALLARERSGVLAPALLAVGWSAGVVGAAYAGLAYGWFLPPATPAVAAGFGLIGVVTEKFWLERHRRHQVQAMFGSYVAPEVVERLVRDPEAIKLGGERRDATVFFCDLAGFTDLSEQVSPSELLELINGYLQETSDCLMEHRAYIDKYIGDAVMAVFGAPQEQPDHALAACRAALAAQRVLALRNVRLAASHGRTLHMRIGINTGDMTVGNLGSERKRNYTVLGDAVNLASRLEGANKEFGTSILLGEATAARVRDHLVLRPLTALRVKGKQTAVQVFELVGEPADVTPEQQAFLRAYGEGHAGYVSRRFAAAAEALARAAALAPADEFTGQLLAEARAFAAHPPPADWQPILALKSK